MLSFLLLLKDLNPKNLFVDEKGILKIGDLAICKMEQPNTAAANNSVDR
jgi:hypothetical protein